MKDREPGVILHCKILSGRLVGCYRLPEVYFQRCTEQGASTVVPTGSSGQSKRAAWQGSLNSTRRQVVELFLNVEIVRDLKQESQVLQTSTVCPKKQ